MTPLSITARLTLLFSTVSILVLLVTGVLISTLIAAHFEEQDMMALQGKLELVRHELRQVRTPSELAALPHTLSEALIGHRDLSVAILGPDRRLLFRSPHAGFATHLLAPPLPGSSAGPQLVAWSHGKEAYRGMAATVATAMPGEPPLIVALAINIEHHRTFLASFHHQLWLAIVVSIVLTTLLGWVAARRGLAPVRAMAAVATGISASHLSERLAAATVPAELVDLALAFNGMLARLEDSFQRLSDFSSDLAHELRTPISNLMTQTQVALSRTRTAEDYREVLYSSLEEYERLARMIADMLFLAKADHGLLKPSRDTVDLAAEVRDLFGFYEAFAEAQGVGLELVGAASARGDPLMLRRAVSNVLSNAIRHTPRQGTVKVILKPGTAPGSVELGVENPGAGIAPEHLPRLFDRFYRVDAARQKAGEGAGLGLAITKSIIEAHQGRIAAYSENGVTRFVILLPAAGTAG